MSRRVVLWTLALFASLSFVGNTQAADFSLTYLEDRLIQEVELDVELSLHSWQLTNTSDEVQTYTCTHFGDRPVEWFDFMCIGDECVFDSTDVTLGVGEEDSVSIHISPLLVAGGAYKTLRVRSHGAQPETLEVDLTTLSGVTTLLVADGWDHLDPIDSYYRTAAENAGLLSGVWHTALEPILSSDLDGKENVVWYTGSETSTLSSGEQQVIQDYLLAAGRLLISGQNIAEDLQADPFLAGVLHASLENPNVASTHVDGVPGDPVGNGLSFNIAGGDGANNQTSPDGIAPLPGAHLALTYDTMDGAGIRFTNTQQRLVYLGFGFEAISSQSDRQDLFDNVLAWFDSEISSVDESELAVATPFVKAGPNPFSPQRPIALEFDSGTSPTPWSVEWFDASGRLVSRQLGYSSDGQIRLEWSGLADGTPLSSGVYLYRLEAGSQAATGRALFLDR
jgi:hypothetical protein